MLATCSAITGAEIPVGAAEDSVNIVPALLEAELSTPVRRDLIHHSATGVFSIRRAEWKLILGTQGSGGWPPPSGGPPEPDVPGQLYNLANDPWEQHNLWDEQPDMVAEFSRLALFPPQIQFTLAEHAGWRYNDPTLCTRDRYPLPTHERVLSTKVELDCFVG